MEEKVLLSFPKYQKLFSVKVDLTSVHVVTGLVSSDSIPPFIAALPAAVVPQRLMKVIKVSPLALLQ